ncbi:MAG: hypothetical protein DRJ01_01095 [Bacteroidetes bacterium]|nr:MAG: hypothetical protein DRJ01_01095 [Bacteroidota bacterium]
MEFKRWNSIENHYQTAILNRFSESNPDLKNADVEITEKIHGANFSILGTPDGEIRFASRNGFLEPDAKFYDYQNLFKQREYVELIDFIKVLAEETGTDIQVYGELYGGGVQKGVFYGTDKYFRWYSLRVNGLIVSPKEADKYLILFQHLKVPVIGVFNVGGDLIKFIDEVDTKFRSKLTPEEYEGDNICEGVVIVSHERVFYNQSSLFLVKKKNDEFKDKAHKPKRDRQVKVVPENIQEMIDEALTYVNENRTNDLFSKIGVMESMKDASKFAKEYFNDLFIDFEKDNYTEWNDLESKEQGMVKKKLGTSIFKELKESLSR